MSDNLSREEEERNYTIHNLPDYADAYHRSVHEYNSHRIDLLKALTYTSVPEPRDLDLSRQVPDLRPPVLIRGHTMASAGAWADLVARWALITHQETVREGPGAVSHFKFVCNFVSEEIRSAVRSLFPTDETLHMTIVRVLQVYLGEHPCLTSSGTTLFPPFPAYENTLIPVTRHRKQWQWVGKNYHRALAA